MIMDVLPLLYPALGMSSHLNLPVVCRSPSVTNTNQGPARSPPSAAAQESLLGPDERFGLLLSPLDIPVGSVSKK